MQLAAAFARAEALLRQISGPSVLRICCARRFTLRPGSLASSARLAEDLRKLRQQSRALEGQGCFTSHHADEADVLVNIEFTLFRCAAFR